MSAYFLIGTTKMDSPLNDIRIGHVCHDWAQTQKIKSFYFPEIASTNSKAKADAFAEDTLAEHLILYFADAQTAGRGRGTNTWSTAIPGSQLLSTWSFMLQEHVQPILSPLVGLALYKSALTTWPFLNFNLKAPNDLYIGTKKIGGLLLETISQGDDIRLLLGLGFNVLSHPSDLSLATNLVAELPKTAPLLAQDWITFLERFIFEVSIAIQLSAEPMDSTVCTTLLFALNKHPHLKEKYTAIDGDGSLRTESQKLNWFDL